MTLSPWLDDVFDYGDFESPDCDTGGDEEEDAAEFGDYDPDEDFREALTAAERNPSLLR
jgi:hypothetical protein